LGQAHAQLTTPGLPKEVTEALRKADLPAQAVSFWVAPLSKRDLGTPPQAPRPLLAWRAQEAMNPASVMKLLTTSAALDLLGPSFAWRTPVYGEGLLRDGVLHGDVYIQGQGDPTLVVERLWLLLRRLRQWGVEQIQGDIVLDRSAFEATTTNPADFDGDPLRPYNVVADALMLNYRAWSATFTPDPNQSIAHIQTNPPLLGVEVPTSVPLSAGPCTDWHGQLRANWEQALQLSFKGSYPASCGERMWSMAYPDPAHYDARLLGALWHSLGGRLQGSVREGKVPAGLTPWFSQSSPPLAEVVRDINKFSNNLMAQQLFLTLSQQASGLGSTEASRGLVRQWWTQTVGPVMELPDIDNGSGLSRQSRISAQALGRLLNHVWYQGAMPELLASLPWVGVDGTLKNMGPTPLSADWGMAHLKSGSLRHVSAVAGVVRNPQGDYFVVVAMANHEHASSFHPVVQSLLAWLKQAH
jgi:D-alanyl-D-alanine carboxypeptidase/D-alanyl-D-alanine-endopeptidase (penicillin-binding protein 4)